MSGTEHTVGDALSWLNINTLDTTTSIDFNRFAKAQQGDKEFQHLRARSTLLKFNEVPLPLSEGTIVCDFYPLAFLHPYVPVEFRQIVFDALQNLSHPGVRAMQHHVTQRFV